MYWKISDTRVPSPATASKPERRETALLTPEATPVWSSRTAAMTAVETGATTIAMPKPRSIIGGSTPVQKAREPTAKDSQR